jgi:L-fuconate dehydratase
MSTCSIEKIAVFDVRYPLPRGAGCDAVHTDPEYCLATTLLESPSSGLTGTGFALTLGAGNKLVCEAIEMLARPLRGRPIEDLMAQIRRLKLSAVCFERFFLFFENHSSQGKY